jgi:hypothetical protein
MLRTWGIVPLVMELSTATTEPLPLGSRSVILMTPDLSKGSHLSVSVPAPLRVAARRGQKPSPKKPHP